MMPQILPPLDPEIAVPVQDHLTANGVTLVLGDAVSGFSTHGHDATMTVSTQSGKTISTDMVLLAIGVRPETSLAAEAGLEIGELGGIRVDDQMRTSDESIWAVGDAVEVRDFVTGEWALIPLAGPANRQGRVAADVILGRDSSFRGVQATAVCRVFNMTVAATGASEKTLKRLDKPSSLGTYEKVYLHPGHHVEYYPGAKPMTIKLLFSVPDGRVLGAQAVGEQGVDKRVDVMAMAIQTGSTVFDLEQAELCYAPPFGAAKDPINIAGMIAANALRGDAPVAHWGEVELTKSPILDVREPSEFLMGHVDGAVSMPLGTLRDRLGELPHDQEILTYCAVGQRSYYASRALRLSGFEARNLSGGMEAYNLLRRRAEPPSGETDS
jgi:rhodanese-related sulfurtransferase